MKIKWLLIPLLLGSLTCLDGLKSRAQYRMGSGGPAAVKKEKKKKIKKKKAKKKSIKKQ